MPLCALPTVLSSWIEHLRCSLDRRLHDRFGSIFFGLFFTRERRRTASSWFRAGEIGEDFRRAYETIGSVGRQAVPMATTMVHQVDHIQVVADGGYCKKPFLDAARRLGISVAGRLRCDSASCTLPEEQPASKRGRKPIYGKQRIELAKRAGQSGGWLEEEMAIYGEVKTKRFKTFLATWRPAGGLIRVVLVDEPTGWVAYCGTDPNATAAEILGFVSERGALEQTFHDVKEVEGTGEQQLRNPNANVGAFHMNLWAYTMVEVWAWDKPEEELVDRSASPWDREYRRPSHADRRKCLIRELLRAEIQAVCSEPLQREKLQESLEKLLQLAV